MVEGICGQRFKYDLTHFNKISIITDIEDATTVYRDLRR